MHLAERVKRVKTSLLQLTKINQNDNPEHTLNGSDYIYYRCEHPEKVVNDDYHCCCVTF